MNDTYREELIAFAEANPWPPPWSPEMIRRFLSGIISSPEMVIDLWEDGRRVAFGAVLDQLENPSNNACLEVLGIAPGFDPAQVLGTMVAEARRRLPAHKAGFQLTPGDLTALPPAWFAERGLIPSYEVFELVRTAAETPPPALMPGFTNYTPADDRELYEVLRESFRESPDMFLAPFDDWHARNEAHPPQGFVHRAESGAVQGFVYFMCDSEKSEAEIHVLGVLPAARNRGIGRALLSEALREIDEAGIAVCKLTAGTKNRSALGLYERFGFRVAGKKSIYVGR